MAAEPREKPMSLEEFAAHAAELYERMEREGGSIVVEQGDLLFTVRPEHRSERSTKEDTQPAERNPLWDIVGMAPSGEPNNDVASNKYKHVADAIASYKGTPAQTQEEQHPPKDASSPEQASSDRHE